MSTILTIYLSEIYHTITARYSKPNAFSAFSLCCFNYFKPKVCARYIFVLLLIPSHMSAYLGQAVVYILDAVVDDDWYMQTVTVTELRKCLQFNRCQMCCICPLPLLSDLHLLTDCRVMFKLHTITTKSIAAIRFW